MTLRPTVAGFVMKPADPYPLVGIHWPAKAAACGEGNLTTAGGGIHANETPAQAMLRELEEEYNITDAEVTVMCHPRWEYHGKLYTWCLVQCRTGPRPEVNPDEVAGFGWWAAPDQLRVAVREMHDEKRHMFLRAFNIACNLEPTLFGGYISYFKGLKKARRECATS